MGEMQRPDPRRLRVRDADRQKVAEIVRDAAGDGRLSLDELDERLDAVWQARTYADLEPITADLQHDLPVPAPGAAPARRTPSGVAGTAVTKSTAVLGDCKREGVWTAAERQQAVAVMGDVLLDFRHAVLTSSEVVVKASAFLGDVKILVPADMEVVMDGTAVMGDFKQRKDATPSELSSGSPRIVVTGVAVMGDVSVRRVPPVGTPKKFFGTY